MVTVSVTLYSCNDQNALLGSTFSMWLVIREKLMRQSRI